MSRVQIAKWYGHKLEIAGTESGGTVRLCFIEGSDILFLTTNGEFRFTNKCFEEKDGTFRFPSDRGEIAILTPPPDRKKFRRKN